jgi:hypothetical protein
MAFGKFDTITLLLGWLYILDRGDRQDSLYILVAITTTNSSCLIGAIMINYQNKSEG